MSIPCRGCGEQIDFVVIARSGKRHPVDAESLQSYTLTPGVVVVTEDGQILRGREETKDTVVRGVSEPLCELPSRGVVQEEAMKTEYQYIRFVEIPHQRRKTRLFDCYNRRSNAVLGFVFWYAPWRQYCFDPVKGTVFSGGCLADVQDFIRQLMEERKT